MTHARRLFLSLAAVLLLAGCAGVAPAPEPQVRAALAPTGTLRVGVYPGSPTSMVRDPKTGKTAGIAFDLGQALGRRLGVPVQVVEFSRVAQVLEALKAGRVDFTFTNATEARARDMDFTPPLIQLELGYLVPVGSPIAAAADVDRPGVRVGVSQGSTSQGTLGRQFKSAAIVPAALSSRRRSCFSTARSTPLPPTRASCSKCPTSCPACASSTAAGASNTSPSRFPRGARRGWHSCSSLRTRRVPAACCNPP